MRIRLILISLIIISSCRNKEEISILNDYFVNEVGIFPLDHDSISILKFNSLCQIYLKEFSKVDSIGNQVQFDSYSIHYEHDIYPPDTSFTDRFGQLLSTIEKDKLSKVNSMAYIVIKGTNNEVYDKQKRISQLIFDFTKDINVVIGDFNSTEWFNSTLWKAYRIDNFNDPIKDVVNQISIHVYRETEFCRAITMGLNKFCLPEVSIKAFTCSHGNSYVSLINSAAQTLAENPYISNDSTLKISLKRIQNKTIREDLENSTYKNAKGIARVRFKTVDPEEGDNNSTQFAMIFNSTKFSSPQQEQDNIISSLFGSEDAISYINHDSLLLETSKKARERLPELKQMFNEGLAPGYAILVKAPFKIATGGNEWMWVEVTKWSNDSIIGILQNDPFEIKDLKAGAIVNIKESDLFDYMLYKPDGTIEGNDTGKMIEKINNSL